MQLSEQSFLSGPNAHFLAELYTRYLEDPGSLDLSWQNFFAGLGEDAALALRDLQGASWQPRAAIAGGHNGRAANGAPIAAERLARLPGGLATDDLLATARASLRALMLIRAYRVRGHLEANLDPLGLKPIEAHPDLDYRTYGFTEEDLDRPVFIDGVLGLQMASLRDILTRLRETYSGSIGVEYMHIQDPAQRIWIQDRIESIHNQTDFSERGKIAILERLTAAETFERFLDKKYTGTKRFGLEGGESAIPALEQIIKRGSQLGLREVVLGMAHRGRLNVLANFMGKPFAALFSEFQGNAAHPEDVQGSGDVKYHLGTSTDREFDGIRVHLSLTANPSHLEAVNTVVLGKTRAKQVQRGDSSRDQVMAILIHGDAAFAGQGLVAETLDLSDLKGYRTGGTIHFIINNQIGFTTNPVNSRSGPYCSEVAKIIQAPIFHVNGDDPEAVVHVTRIATEFRQHFKRDVVIDMFCYRRFGHNEIDEPGFTQPLMYEKIAKHPTTRAIYSEKLIQQGLLTSEHAQSIMDSYQQRLEADYQASPAYKPNKADWLEGAWSGLSQAVNDDRRGQTEVPLATLQAIGRALTRLPEGFHANRKITRLLEAKQKLFEAGEGMDWATAEALAIGSLLLEGSPVRLSGQDVGRGTFSQRHAVLIDQKTEENYIPLNHIQAGQKLFEVVDSPLSEAGVLGFEYGYSLAEPRALIIWEAQFGDFANGAQVIVDQFISSGEAKWLRMSGLVVLLPHGYEGQGPEHSSARLERWLQLCGGDNMQVAYCTTPANYFHILRRQLRRNFRKPLILMTPKSLLRDKRVVSKLTDMAEGTSFHRVLPDDMPPVADKDVRRVVLCSGKIYYDLLEAREKSGAKDVVFIRLEQLYPFPVKSVTALLQRFPKASYVWCQEEPKNMGAWFFVMSELEGIMDQLGVRQRRLIYAGRAAAAAPATGLYSRHLQEQAALLAEALNPDYKG